MITKITGKIIFLSEKFIVVETNGIGYKIFVPTEVSHQNKKVGVEISLWTHFAVREDAQTLYGFLEKEDLDFFELLITISGIGPKTALGIMSMATVDGLKRAIKTGEVGPLVKISGMGKKMADKIVLELKDKIIGEAGDYEGLKEESDALEALKTLGYSHDEARDALKKVGDEHKETGKKIKEALKILGK
ncbi:MAG: Holliday junction branch migration protein RuvA [Minisyncoccia bacterium]